MTSIRYVRGYLGALPANAHVYAPDSDIPLEDIGLSKMPIIRPICTAPPGSTVFVLEAHRCPFTVLAQVIAVRRPAVIVGDPESLGHRTCRRFADELLRLPLCRCPRPPALLRMATSLDDAISMARGEVRILVSDRHACATVKRAVRPNGQWLSGDRVRVVRGSHFGTVALIKDVNFTRVTLDTGVVVPLCDLEWSVVETPSSMGSCKCDSMIVMPDVAELVGRSCTRRTRYMIISVGVAPGIYQPVYEQ